MRYKDRVNICLEQLKKESEKHKKQSEDHRKHNGKELAKKHWLYAEGIDHAINEINKL